MFEVKNVYMGTLTPSWGANKKIKTITFSITDDCNLRCTYCYFTHKTHKNVMTFATAQKAIDDILTESLYDNYEGVIWEFIGGEPTIEMDLIDKISDYILFRMYELDHKWLYCYRFMIGTNGLLYDDDAVQNYIKKHYGNLYVAITIDGSKEKHDLSRIKKDGSGSYDDIRRILPMWQKQFGGITTKATFSHEDLPFLKDSIINLWNIGIRCVAANIVFEDVWEDGDVEIYKDQLYKLADYIIDNDLWDKYSVRFFDPTVGTPYTEDSMRTNFCGTGSMLAINTQGEYYPCVRFMPSAANKHTIHMLGSTDSRIDPDRLRAFYVLNTRNQSPQKCLECDIAGGCAWCSGLNYDDSTIGTLFERQTHFCEMQKANVEVNKYLWRRYELEKHSISPYRYKKLSSISPYNKYLYVICDSSFPSFCEYSNRSSYPRLVMSNETLVKTIKFCEEENFVPIFCGNIDLPLDYYAFQMITLSDYLNGKHKNNSNYLTQLLLYLEEIPEDINFEGVTNIIISYKASQLESLYSLMLKWSKKWRSLSVNITMRENDINPEEYICNYKVFLGKILNIIISSWESKNYFSVNVITNELFANTNRSCGAGKNSYAVSPDGNIYICAGFYHEYPDNHIGNIETGLNNIYSKYCDMDRAPLCENCSVRHCSRCVLKNKRGTGEYNIPTELQCVISHMEYEYSHQLSQLLNSGELHFPGEYNTELEKIKWYDPLHSIRGNDYPNHGYNNIAAEMKSSIKATLD